MLHARQELAFRRTIALQFIGNDHARDVLESFEKLAEELFGRVLIASALRPAYPTRCHPDPPLARDSGFCR
jgi:hypothetical protein